MQQQQMNDLQFYPTPPDLARRAWKKFKNHDFKRVLDPEAGNGDLADANPHVDSWRSKQFKPDCIEIDITRHATLQSKGLKVVGLDFMTFTSGAIYSHIIMNPPFAVGTKHVLKAWDILWDGEISAILNAETIRNPFSAERQHLVRLIEQHGEVEFIEGAFSVEEAKRKTQVDVALVYLRKQANESEDIIGPILDELKRDSKTEADLSDNYREAAELALPNSLVENSVAAFNAAVRAMREAVLKEARAEYYSRLLGETMAVRSGDHADREAAGDTSVDYVRNTIGKRYDDLKDRAWSGILRSANVTSKLSSAAQKRVESEFEQIKQLEFTVQTIYGFLCGIVNSQGKIQLDMACDVFDLITRYHSDNTVFYKGWKSNDKHRTAGMRIKTTRFILPGRSGYANNLQYESMQLLRDFDKVFAMLDGKHQPAISLEYVFDHHYRDLRTGGRVSSSYFDVRFYPGAGTIHFFARDKKLVDRLNRLVGRHRKWLPPEEARVSDAFWLQYDNAEKFDKEIRVEVQKGIRNYWDNPLSHLTGCDDERKTKAHESMDVAITAVLERHGINVDFLLQSKQQEHLLLEAA
ncbi:MAG: DUF4942 domain-containing protein [Sideroxydans sp.]|nr:DUF4942 domain-containing protein [Sideroxydans sp.]MDD5056680.1 DUF4942 domain-containing protein [Sideroxydans sp.]